MAKQSAVDRWMPVQFRPEGLLKMFDIEKQKQMKKDLACLIDSYLPFLDVNKKQLLLDKLNNELVYAYHTRNSPYSWTGNIEGDIPTFDYENNNLKSWGFIDQNENIENKTLNNTLE